MGRSMYVEVVRMCGSSAVLLGTMEELVVGGDVEMEWEESTLDW
jgi:hypothetical protein